MATQRGYYLEELERSINNLSMALEHLARVVDAYKEHHPDISNQAKECGDAIVMVAEVIQQIHDRI